MAPAHWELLASASPSALGGLTLFRPGRKVRAHLIQAKYQVRERGIFAYAPPRNPPWFIEARPDSYSRMRPGSAVLGVLVRNKGRTSVGVTRIAMLLDSPHSSKKPRILSSKSPPSRREIPYWISGADLPCELGPLSVDCWCVPTAELDDREPHYQWVSFEVVLETGKALRTTRAKAWWLQYR